MQDVVTETQTMSELNDYAKSLVTRKRAGRPCGVPARAGSVMAGKVQTPWEVRTTASELARNKKRWAELFAKPLNKWTLHP